MYIAANIYIILKFNSDPYLDLSKYFHVKILDLEDIPTLFL